MSANKYPTNTPNASGLGSSSVAVEEVREGDEEGLDMTPTRITFYVPVVISGIEDFRIDVPAYLLERPEAELKRYIRDNMGDADSRDMQHDDYEYNYADMEIT